MAQARNELTEIPNRLLGELRLGGETFDNRTNVELQSALWSPDEYAIRQRGRRRLTTNWSPPDEGTAKQLSSPFQRTPTKMPISNSMILRSSPRKRLTMGLTPPDPRESNSTRSPIKLHAKLRFNVLEAPPNAKKQRFNETNERSMAQQNDAPLELLLRGYSQVQLVEIILKNVIGSDDNSKIKEKEFRARLPKPSINAFKNELLHAKTNIYKSLPTSRLCKKTDSAAYSRAALHLTEFKRLLNLHAKQLQESGHWDSLLDYIAMAWPLISATPLWDNEAHNSVRRQCFKLLACLCVAAVKAGGLRLGTTRLIELEQNIRIWSKDYEDVLVCITALNKILAKGRSSL